MPPTEMVGYEPLVPRATYAPWVCDAAFNLTYREIEPYTLVDIYRCWELWSIARQVEGDVLEVGVWRGGTGALLARGASSRTVYLCDTFKGVVKAGRFDPFYRNGEHSDASESSVAWVLERMGIENVKILTGVFPEDTAELIPSPAKFGLCHIDVDTYQSAKDVMSWVWPRIVIGGVVVYDDYGFDKCSGVTRHVNELSDGLVLYNLNGHAVVVKTR